MSLRFSTTGVAVYGVGPTIAVDGSTPAALTGTVGPAAWENTGILVYQDGGTGSGPWTLKRLTLPATIANIDSSPASQIVGGGGQWGAFASGLGVRTDIAIGPFASAALGDMSADGELVIMDAATGVLAGITVYDSSGGTLYADPTVVLQSAQVCLRDNFLSYYTATGWHLVDITTGQPPEWYPRTDGVTALVPLTHRGTLYVLERSNVLVLRQANKSDGWILSSDPNIFPIDGVSLNANTVLCGTCNVPSETPASLVTFRCTVTKANTIQVATGTIVAGAIVYGTAVSVGVSPFTVGALEGNSFAPSGKLPVTQRVVHESTGLMTHPWVMNLERLDTLFTGLAEIVQNTPSPSLLTTAFDKVASSGQPTLQAQSGMTTLTVEPSEHIILDPATNTITLDGLGVSYVPVSTGAEPLVILSNGAGAVLLTPFTP